MRKVPIAIAVSMVLHTAAIAWVHTRAEPKPQRRPVVSAPAPAAPTEPLAMAVTLLDDDTVSRTPAATLGPGGGIRNAVSTNHAPVTETAHEPPKHSPLMTMRHPEVTHGVSQDFLDKFLASSKPLAKPDIDGERIASDIAHDRSELNSAAWIANATPDQVRMAREDLEQRRAEQDGEELHPAGGGSYEAKQRTFTAHVEPDGTVHLKDEPNLQADGLGGSFDVTDWAMRSHGIDPYASKKLRLLDKTRDERVAIGKRYRHQQLLHSSELMQQNVAWLWAKTRDPALRKQGLFELWDECAEAGDDDVITGGAAARAFVLGFIQSKLPAGSAGAFTADELVELNAHRHSKASFAPY